ncbi:MAG: nuclear transport factor 2 family protein, partial [Deltaproteobacteria bacterium]|nr:nuclear transport factor 2 family protein [Deltaproteobacteria bacterium]
MSNTLALDTRVNELVFSGKAMEAFEEFYDEDVIMQENTEAEYVGKAFNRKREQDFFATIEAWHGGSVIANAANGDVSFSESTMDVTLKGVGRIQMAQATVRRWKNGKIVHERFYHK